MGWGLLQGIGQGMQQAGSNMYEQAKLERIQEYKQQQTQAQWDREDTHRAEDQAAAVASKQDDRAYDLVKQQNQYKLQMEMERMKQRTANGKFGAAKPGINPDTGKPDHFRTNANGDVEWNGIAPIPKSGTNNAGPFSGTSMDAQYLNIVTNGDPSTPEYSVAYHQLFNKPQMVQTDNGLLPVTITPPASVRAPVYKEGGPADRPPSTSEQSIVPKSADGVTTQPVIPGTAKSTESQKNARGFSGRMNNAEQEIERVLGSTNYQPGSVVEHTRAGLPLVGNHAASAEYQQYKQAADDWIRAKLRKESGAVIGEEEMAAEFRNYFPQPGDGPEVIAQKRRARQQAITAMGESAGVPALAGEAPKGVTKQLNGKTYINVDGEWYEQ